MPEAIVCINIILLLKAPSLSVPCLSNTLPPISLGYSCGQRPDQNNKEYTMRQRLTFNTDDGQWF